LNESPETRAGTAWLKRIQQHLPGFQGYEDARIRSGEDERLRNHLAGIVAKGISRLEQFVILAANEKRLDLLSDFEQMITGLQTLRRELETAAESADEDLEIDCESISECHREDFELIESLNAFTDRIEHFEAPLPERNDVLLLLKTLDRLLLRTGERKKRWGGTRADPESADG